jgi:Pentapeptide repeats (9 copies)
VENELAIEVVNTLTSATGSVELRAVNLASDLTLSNSTLFDFIAIDCIFQGHVTLSEVKILGELKLDKTEFKKSLRFENCAIMKAAALQSIVVHGQVCIVSTVFHDDSHLGDNEFKGITSFEGSIFRRYSSFRDCIFEDYAIFRKTNFHGYFNCKRAIFTRDTVFDHANFAAVTTFDNAKFKEDVSFADCRFDRPPTFQSAEFSGWLSATQASFTDTSSVESYTAYRTLRLIFAAKDAKREEMQMFRLEQDSLTHREPSRILKVLGRLYGFISLYGTSVTRPATLLFLTTTTFYFAYLVFAVLQTKPVADQYSVAATHLFKQVFSPFSVWTKENEPTWIESGQLLLQLLSSVQSFITLTTVALVSVALHWRFRKN